MLRTFIFDESKSNWIEEKHLLLLHDICAVLDEEKSKIYIWNGPKSSKERFKKGYNQVRELVSNYPDEEFQIVLLEKEVPSKIQNRLDSMLESIKMGGENLLKFSRFVTLRVYFIFLISAIILPIISFLNLSSSLLWSFSNGNYQISSNIFEIWINLSKNLIFATLFVFIINIIVGAIERENQVIVFSIIGLILCIGLTLYLNQGIFLFLFQSGSTLANYIISQKDIFIFLLLNLTAILIFEILNNYKFISLFKTYKKFIF